MDHGIMDHKEDGRDLLSIEEIKSFAVNYPDKFGTLERACNIVTVGTHVDGQFTISSLDFVLLPLKIIECNALNNVSFSDAYCNVQQYKDICICFAGLFKKGCSDLVDFLRDNKVPTDESRRKALRKLVTFFAKDFDAVVTSEEVQLRNEAHVCLFLMNHLISKLSVKEEWKIDYGITGKHALVCPCSTTDCPVKYADADDVFADLSIGNSEVWHGAVDALTFSGVQIAEVACVVLDEGAADDTNDGNEAEDLYSCLASEFKEKNKSQLFAETIVNSFLQKSLDSSVSFVPILGVKHNAIQIVMYDAELDILLASVELKLNYPASALKEMSYAAYLLTWLACNFKIFSTVLDEKEMLELKSKCANFVNLVKEKMHIYKNELRFKKVRCKANENGFMVPKTGDAVMYGYDPQLQIKKARLN